MCTTLSCTVTFGYPQFRIIPELSFHRRHLIFKIFVTDC
ncbi:unnamed protein product [Brugia timori]|uniref:Uncharacterized protein n=1 Tax=Brugia timori TaxID=42155 RepID=A0A0R3QGT2_9BILA|nr:unnamed protein product [Brugia timori]